MSRLVMNAFDLAREAHESIGQKRKYTGEPYYLHPWNVAVMVGLDIGRDHVVAAAALHDVLEDVGEDPWVARINHITDGDDDVLRLVRELTHVFTTEAYPQLNRAARKQREAERIAATSADARLIKTADNLDNIRTIAVHDPEFAKTYAAEMRLYFDSLPSSLLKAELGQWLAKIENAP